MSTRVNQLQAVRYVVAIWGLLFFFSFSLYAQKLNVTGNVKDATGEISKHDRLLRLTWRLILARRKRLR